MGFSSIITFLSPSLENYWGARAPSAPPLATALEIDKNCAMQAATL